MSSEKKFNKIMKFRNTIWHRFLSFLYLHCVLPNLPLSIIVTVEELPASHCVERKTEREREDPSSLFPPSTAGWLATGGRRGRNWVTSVAGTTRRADGSKRTRTGAARCTAVDVDKLTHSCIKDQGAGILSIDHWPIYRDVFFCHSRQSIFTPKW